jgi:PAS domain S-box-containing protein
MDKKTATILLAATLFILISLIAIHLVTQAYDVIIVLLQIILIALIIVFYRVFNKTIKSLENAKNEADKQTRLIVNSTPRICILFDSEYNLVDCNPATTQLLGFSTKEETLAGFIQRVEETTLTYQGEGHSYMLVTDWAAAAAKDGHIKFEHELNINGRYHILSVEMKKVPYENSFAVVGYAHDITDAREREKELTRANELNKLQLTKLNLMVKGSNIGLWDMTVVQGDLVNPNNTITFSDEFRSLLGYESESEFPNVISSLNDNFHPDDKQMVTDAITAHLLDKTGMTPFNIEYRLKRKSGEYGYFNAMGETIRDEEGNPVRAAGALIDITEAKNLIREATRQRAEAVAANKAKSSFLSTMSHEIRTPMNAILGITEIQLLNDSLDEGVREALEKINNSGGLLLGIINNILDLSKIEAGKLELVIDRYSSASLISDSAQLNVMQIGSKLIEFELQIDENIPAYLSGDKLRVKQILNNLLSNAFKYTVKGTVTLAVKTEEEEEEENSNEIILVLQVKDTGQGMTKEQVDSLFDEFARFNMEANRTIEGTGLGMSITQNLIKLMNGKISIESEPGKGTEFTVRLPQKRAGEEILDSDVIENLKLFRTNGGARKTRQVTRELMPYGSVLIVDDVDTNIYVAMGLMAPYELSMDSAVSGFNAIDKIKSGKVYDIIFMDHMMPKMDGIETVRIIRESGYTHPIVALTANAVLGNADMFLENGFDDFISKPIDIRQLNSILKKFIRDKQSPEVLKAAEHSIYYAPADDVKAVRFIAPETEIPGVDIARGLERYSNNEEVYLKILRAYVASLRSLLEAYETVNNNEDELSDYKIRIHGIKGASLNIYAEPVAEITLKLEKAAAARDFEYVSEHHPAFLEMGRKLADNLDKMLSLIDAENPKPAKEQPDSELLTRLSNACEVYDIDEVDAAMEELEKYRYESDGGLMEWLKKHLALMKYPEIVERLSSIN